MSKVYFSETDKFHRNLYLFFLGTMSFAVIVVLITKFILKSEIKMSLVYFLSMGYLLMSIFTYFLYFHFRYIIGFGYLEIRIGPFMRKSININDIREIRAKRRTQAIYGNSFKTISIILKCGIEINISPNFADSIIDDLVKINKTIIVNT